MFSKNNIMAKWTIAGLQQGVEHAVNGIILVARNPSIRQHKFIRIFLYLSIFSFLLFGIARLVISLPVQILRLMLWIVGGPDRLGGTDDILVSVNRNIGDMMSSLPFLVLLFMRYLYPKPLDDLFMESLRFIDSQHPERTPYASSLSKRRYRKEYWINMKGYMKRSWKNLRLGIIIFLLSRLPVVGQFVFPAAGAYATFKSLGQTQGAVVGVCFLFLPRWATISLIKALIGMRALMRELLEPYFVRMGLSHKEKRRWFSGRKDILFGFSAIAYILTRIPVVGFVGFGVAQAAAAYMLTIVTDPPSPNGSPKQQPSIDSITLSDDIKSQQHQEQEQLPSPEVENKKTI
ncbi:hypothetical protein BDA99DRAFT_554379 [Phascolomyces articulosus]|uniref:Transmembrane protein UsgS n=1 Tax=Phascolomyces articulosus TaxID=60185 RepID=A0AAD5KCL9_9FUNG|nr:hypothetical protein BDA99DRAFT_554379 [Phascolomyces articulosus]